MRFKELLQPAEQVATAVKIESRRRPGRNDRISPHLVPLLRNPTTVNIAVSQPDQLDPLPLDDGFALLKGIAVGLVLGVPLWAIIGAIVWVMLG